MLLRRRKRNEETPLRSFKRNKEATIYCQFDFCDVWIGNPLKRLVGFTWMACRSPPPFDCHIIGRYETHSLTLTWQLRNGKKLRERERDGKSNSIILFFPRGGATDCLSVWIGGWNWLVDLESTLNFIRIITLYFAFFSSSGQIDIRRFIFSITTVLQLEPL